MQSNTGIHCKVVCNEQIRRFQFFGTEFSSLQDQVKKLLGLNGEFVLKYKDNEDDMITISSTEELSCAIDISHKNDGGLIRLTVYSAEPNTFPVAPQCPIPTNTTTTTQPEQGRGDFCPRGRGGRGGRWGGRGGGGGRWCHREGSPSFSNENPCRFERRRAKLTFKRDMWKAYLSSLEESGELSPEEERRKQMFQAKVQRLDSILAEFGPPKEKVAGGPEENEDISPNETFVVPFPPNCCPAKENEIENEFSPPKDRYRHKFYKKERKCQRKEKKNERKQKGAKNFLSLEEKSEIKALKSQIKDMKPSLWAIQEQLKVKKSEISVAKETNQQAKIIDLKNEILKLKQEKRAKKEQIEPLRQRVHQLKGKKN